MAIYKTIYKTNKKAFCVTNLYSMVDVYKLSQGYQYLFLDYIFM